MPKVTRFDAGELKLKADAWETPDGFLCGHVLGTKVGVFPYADEKGNVHYEYRPAEELFKADTLASMKGIPITLGHPTEGLVNADNASRLLKGFTGNEVHPDGDRIYAEVTVTHRDAIEAVKAGKEQVSYGYRVELVQQKGDYKGVPYDYIQTNISYNHLALVDRARMGPDAKIMADAADTRTGQPVMRLDGLGNQVITEIKQDSNKQDEVKAMPKFKIDNLEYDAAPEVINHLDKLQKSHDELKAKADSVPGLNTQIQTLTGQRDQLKADLEAEQKKDRGPDIRAAAVRLNRIHEAAHKVLDKDAIAKLDSTPELDTMKAVIVAQADAERRDSLKAVLDGKDAAYVEARFDQVAEALPAGPGGLTTVILPKADAADQTATPGETERDKMIKRDQAAHKASGK